MSQSNKWVMEVLTESDVPIYVRAYDLEFASGRGFVAFTHDITLALTWPDQMSVIRSWKTPSKTRPLREDGKPNRPLSALSIAPIELGGHNA